MRNWVIASLLAISSAGIIYYTTPTTMSTEKEFVSFDINNAAAIINQTTGEMDITLPTGTNLTNLVPIFVATGTNVTVIGKPQYSGISYQNFESNVPYVVHAQDGSIKSYFAHVITASNTHQAYFINYAIQLPNGNISFGDISGNNINVIVPSNTNLTSLVSYFNYVGKSAKIGSVKQISNETVNNFTSPVSYNVYNNAGQENTYTVTLTKASTSSKNLTMFKIITGDGTFPCQISGTNIHCGVTPDTVTSHLIAEWSSTGSLVQESGITQTSGLTVNNFISPVNYVVTSGDGSTTKTYAVTVDNNQMFLQTQNLPKTIFDNTSYPVSFVVTNNTSSAETLDDTFVTHDPFTWTLLSDTCNGQSLAATESCTVSGNLSTTEDADAEVDFNVSSGGQPVAEYNNKVESVKTLTELGLGESYAAYSFINNGSHRLFATATVNGNNIQFDGNNIGVFTNHTESYGSDAVELTRGNNTLYIPAYPGVGGKVLISVDNRLPDGPTPSVTATSPADTYYTRWQQVEYGGGLTGSSLPALFNLNPTNVDFTSLPVTISTVISGAVGPYLTNDYVPQGVLFAPWIKTQQVLGAMESGLANVPNASNPSWNGLTQNNAANTSILRILSPSSIFPFMTESSSQFYFDGSFYNQYITDLWAYYTDNGGGNFLYVDDSPVASLVTPGSTCILKCQVTHTDNLMHCAFESGVCPVNSNTGTLDGAYDIGGESSPAGMTEFTPTDFVSAAGVNTVTTFGLNGTYRSITGENIVSGQSVGFLPFCSNTSFVFGTPEFVANMALYYQPQYTCLTNYSTYTVAPLDQYSYQSSLYFLYYNYGYSDTLGQSGAIYSLDNTLYPFTIDMWYQ